MNEVSIIRTGNTERRITKLHNIDGSYAGTISVSRPVSKNNKKRRSDYSFKQISAQVLNAKTSDKASQVRTSIGMKLNLLYKRRKGGEYDEEEITRAILHAEQILRACKKKEKHLKMEEAAEKHMEESAFEEQENPVEEAAADEKEQALESEEFEALMEKLELDMEEMYEKAEETAEFDEELEEFSKALSGDMEPEDLKQLKLKHRSEEQRDILQADLKYLKALFDRLQAEKENNGKKTSSQAYTGSGVIMTFDGMDVPVEPEIPPTPETGGAIDTTL